MLSPFFENILFKGLKKKDFCGILFSSCVYLPFYIQTAKSRKGGAQW